MREFFMEEFKAPVGGRPISNAASPRGSFFPAKNGLHGDKAAAFSPSGTPGGRFRMEGINPSLDLRRQASGSCGSFFAPSSSSAGVLARKSGGEVFNLRGSDPEISFGITFRRIGAGLANLGNTCFLNSVLQCLTYTEPFAAYLQSGKHKSSCRTSGFCALCALQNHVMDALQSTGKILRPFHLVKNLRCISRNFRNARQEDAHEYMVNLLESMHKCCLPSGIASESPTAYEKSLVHRIFGGHLRSQVKCLQCSFCSNKFDPFLDLSLEINKADNLHKALSHFTAAEQLDGGARQYQCQQCKQKVKAVKQLTIHKAPYVLTVHLKRFGTASIGQKIDRKIDFEPSLDLKRYVSGPNEGDLKYTLYGVLVHAGYATYSGHYYCFVRTSGGQWYSLNDHQVCQVSEKTVLQQKAYMLFYVRNMNSTTPKVRSIACKDSGMSKSSVCKGFPAPLDSAKSVQDCATESRVKHHNSLSGSKPLNSTLMDKLSTKNTSGSPKPGLLKDTKTQILPSKEPSPSVSPLSSLTSEDLVPEGLAQKPSPGGSSIQLHEDLMQTAQSQDKSAYLTSADQNLPSDSTKDGASDMVQKEGEESNKVNKAVLERKVLSLPDFRSMMFGPGRLIAYLSMSVKKKRRRIGDRSTKRKRKYGSLKSVDQGDLGPSTSAASKMEPVKKIRCNSAQSKKEARKGSESVGPMTLKRGLTSPKRREESENRKKRRRFSSSTGARNQYFDLAGVMAHKKAKIDQSNSGNKPFRINRGE